jgi:hypothetical protein
MLVNENRQSLATPASLKYLMAQAEQYFLGTNADAASGYVPPVERKLEIAPARFNDLKTLRDRITQA